VIAALIFVVAPTPSEAACFQNSIASTYVFTLAGVNAEGFTISHLGVVTFSVANPNGTGSLQGTILINERGLPTTSQPLSGSYVLDANCFITIQVVEFVGSIARLDALLGYVSQNGAMIIFGSPFDPAVQLAGVATRAQ